MPPSASGLQLEARHRARPLIASFLDARRRRRTLATAAGPAHITPFPRLLMIPQSPSVLPQPRRFGVGTSCYGHYASFLRDAVAAWCTTARKMSKRVCVAEMTALERMCQSRGYFVRAVKRICGRKSLQAFDNRKCVSPAVDSHPAKTALDNESPSARRSPPGSRRLCFWLAWRIYYLQNSRTNSFPSELRLSPIAEGPK